MPKPVTGLALGGIGGFNAHDAGVLSALYDSALVPDIITCTSGAIFWTHEFLIRPEQIREEVERQVEAVEGANALAVALLGDPKIFAPAYQQYWTRWLQPWKALSWKELLDRLLPAQIYEPKRRPQDFASMADVFNHSTIPIVFNAFAISRGRELLFCNPAAFDFLGVTAGLSRPSLLLENEITTEYRSIDAGAVEAALWLVLYGLEHQYEGEIVVDGAYHRQLIISELSMCDIIYAVKPQSDAWHGAPPSNYFEVQDFNTEMWFNSSFAAEIANLRRARPDARLERITMDRPLGFFNFFVEKLENYTDGYEKARKIFERDRDTMHPLIYPLYQETVPEPRSSSRENARVDGAGATGTRTPTGSARATKPRPD
ncbi:MAG: hypothetical protein ACRDUV_15305 [Pseudonocardiaceae bacterium]